MTAEQTLDNRRAAPEHPEDTRIVVGRHRHRRDRRTCRRRRASNSIRRSLRGRRPWLHPARTASERGIHYSNGTRGPKGDDSHRGVVARWHAGRVSQTRDFERKPLGQDVEPGSGVRADAHRRRCRRSARPAIGSRSSAPRVRCQRRRRGRRDGGGETSHSRLSGPDAQRPWHRSGRRTATASSSASACSTPSSTASTVSS